MKKNYVDIVNEMQASRIEAEKLKTKTDEEARMQLTIERRTRLMPLLRVFEAFQGDSRYYVLETDCRVGNYSYIARPRIKAQSIYAKERRYLQIVDDDTGVGLSLLDDCNKFTTLAAPVSYSEIDKLIPVALDIIADMGIHR